MNAMVRWIVHIISPKEQAIREIEKQDSVKDSVTDDPLFKKLDRAYKESVNRERGITSIHDRISGGRE